MSQVIRHGDVILRQVTDPEVHRKIGEVKLASWSKPTREKSITLALGEITGHQHDLTASTDIEMLDVYLGERGRRSTILAVPEGGALLTHQEHDTIKVGPGTYELIRQREQWGKQTRRVLD